MLQRLAFARENGKCPNISVREVEGLLKEVHLVPGLGDFGPVHHVSAKLADQAGDHVRALFHLEMAIESQPRIPLLQQAVVWSLRLQDPARARRHLATATTDPRITWIERWAYRKEIAGSRQLIELYESL